MRLILLTKGLSAIVDDEDYDLVSPFKWYAQPVHNTVYAARRDANRRLVLMHRVINRTPKGVKTDHRDSNGLNNVRTNLRDATSSQNAMNTRPAKGGTSALKGVWLARGGNSRKPWRAAIRVGGKLNYLGYFPTEAEAHAAYAERAKAHFGEFHRTTHGSQS